MSYFDSIDLLNYKTPNNRRVFIAVRSAYSETRKKTIFFYAIYNVRLGRVFIGVAQEIEYINSIVKEFSPKLMVIQRDDDEIDLLTMCATSLPISFMFMELQDAINVYYINRVEPHDALADVKSLYSLEFAVEEQLECIMLTIAYALASSKT